MTIDFYKQMEMFATNEIGDGKCRDCRRITVNTGISELNCSVRNCKRHFCIHCGDELDAVFVEKFNNKQRNIRCHQ